MGFRRRLDVVMEEAVVDRRCSSVGVGEDGGGGAVDGCCRRRRGRWAAVSPNRNSLPLRRHFGQLRLVVGGVTGGGFAISFGEEDGGGFECHGCCDG
ncbi:hypothetical protein ACLOJK_037908 [Asimina triloba]